jgi:hypothetical protein
MTPHVANLPAPDIPAPWAVLIEIARHTDRTMWCVIGGMMVQIHCALAGIPPVRATHDVDLLLNLLAQRTSAGVVADLKRLGFAPQEPGWPDAPFHRLRRRDDVIDILVPDHLPRHIRPSVARRAMMPIEGGAQANSRLIEVDLVGDNTRATVIVPDLLGALVLKAAASVADNRDAERHLPERCDARRPDPRPRRYEGTPPWLRPAPATRLEGPTRGPVPSGMARLAR